MQLHITGHHLDVTPALNEFITEKMTRIKRHFDKIITIHVTIGVENHTHIADATLGVSGKELFAKGYGKDMYAAIDKLIDKLDRQIIKHKEKQHVHRDKHVPEPILEE